MEESFEELVEEYLCAQEGWISLRRRKDKQEPLGEISAGQRAAIEHGARWKMIKERAEDKGVPPRGIRGSYNDLITTAEEAYNNMMIMYEEFTANQPPHHQYAADR